MINYFKDLLKTLKEINKSLKSIDESGRQLSKCVRENHHGHGDRASISTKHWND